MPPPGAGPFHGLLSTTAGVGPGSGADAPDRRPPSGLSVCRRSDAARPAQTRESHNWAQASVHPDDAHGHRVGVPQAPHQPAASSPHGLSLSAAPSGDHALESRVGSGHYLHPDEARLRVSVRRPGLGESAGAGVAAVQYAAHRLLPGGSSGGDHPLWHAGHF